MAWEPETVRKGLQVTKNLEASPSQKTGGRGFERAVLSFRNTKQVLGSFATH
jgi:hypothetical protein